MKIYFIVSRAGAYQRLRSCVGGQATQSAATYNERVIGLYHFSLLMGEQMIICLLISSWAGLGNLPLV